MAQNRSQRPPYKPTIATVAQVTELAARLDSFAQKLAQVLGGIQARQGLTEYALEKLIADLYSDDPDDDVDRGEPHEDDRQGPVSAEEGELDDWEYEDGFIEGDTEDSQESRARHDAEPSTLPPGSATRPYGTEQRATILEQARLAAEADWEGDGGAALSPAERANEG